MRAVRLLTIVLPIALRPAPAWAAEPPQTTAPSAPAAEPATPPAPTWLHRRGWPSVSFGFGATVGWGVAQRVAVGSAFNMMWTWQFIDRPIDGVSILYSLRYDPPAAGGAAPGRQVTTERVLLVLDPCVHRWQLHACAVFGGGRLGIDWRGWTQGGSHDYNPAIAITGGRLGVDVPLTPSFGVRLSGELLGLVNPVTIPVDDLYRWTTPRVSGGLELGLLVMPDPR